MYHQNPAINRLLRLAYLLLLGAVVFAFYKVLFRPLLPLGVAFLLSCLLAGPAEKLHEKSRLPKGLCALLVLAVLAAVLCLSGWLLGRLAMEQLRQLGAFLPVMLADFQESLTALQQRLQRWFPGQKALSEPMDWLSAIPLPDPHAEKRRVRVAYNKLEAHDYSEEGPTMREVKPGHFVYCNSAEEAEYKKELGL